MVSFLQMTPEADLPASQWDNVQTIRHRSASDRTLSSHGDASSVRDFKFMPSSIEVIDPFFRSDKSGPSLPLSPRYRMQRLPHLGAGHTHNIIIVNPNGLPRLPGSQLNQAPSRSIVHQHQSQSAGMSRLHQHPDPGLRTTLLHQDPNQQARRAISQQQSNRPMVTSIMHQRSLPSTAQGPLVHPVDYFYDLGQMNSLDQPGTRMEVPRYSNPVPFTLQNMTTPIPQTPDFHFSLYVLLPPPEHSIRVQQPPVTVYEGNQTFYTTLPVQVRNTIYTPRPSTSSGNQANQPQIPMTSQGNANTQYLSLQQLQQHDCKQKQQCQPQEVQVIQRFQPEVTHSLSKQQHHNLASMQYDPDVVPESKALGSDPNTDPILNPTSCNDNQSQEDNKQYRIGLNQAQNSNQEVETSCGKADGISSIDQNEECEKKLMMLTFEDAVMMFDFELFDHPKLNGQLTEQEQVPSFHVRNKGRNEDNQKKISGKVDDEALPKEENTGSSELAVEHSTSIKLTLAKRSPSSVHIETSGLPHRFTNDHSFYDLKPEQVNLQTLLELEDISDDEGCWESLGHKSRTAEEHASLSAETRPKADSIAARKRKRQFLDLES